ncbi:response regulator transcription factor [Polaromonas sp.]|uniref:response regulator transcription factor n=1 Tax=Polaromonas sp. TaxID=1869339 RepID=UPI002FCA5BE4
MNTAHPLIFVLDDEPSITRLVSAALRQHQFRTEEFHTAAALARRLRTQSPAVAIVDLGLPDRDGLELVRQIGASHGCGILVLTGRDSVSDRVLGLELGADDYLTKPFDSRELVARVRSIARRQSPQARGVRVASFPGWRFEPEANCLWSEAGQPVRLSAAESQLLLQFVTHPNRVLSREHLCGTSDLSPFDRSVDIKVSRLRAKLEAKPHAPQLIRTVYGGGYLFGAAVDWEKTRA